MNYASKEDHEIANLLQNDLYLAGFPETYEVDIKVYEAVERVVLDWLHEAVSLRSFLVIGPNGGLLFRNVELIIKQNRRRM